MTTPKPKSFTDEELVAGVTWDPTVDGLHGLNDLAFRLGATIARLQRERDEARRVAEELEIPDVRWDALEEAAVLAEAYSLSAAKAIRKVRDSIP